MQSAFSLPSGIIKSLNKNLIMKLETTIAHAFRAVVQKLLPNVIVDQYCPWVTTKAPPNRSRPFIRPFLIGAQGP